MEICLCLCTHTIHLGTIANMLSVEISKIKKWRIPSALATQRNEREYYFWVYSCMIVVTFQQCEHFGAWCGGSYHCDLTFCNKIISDTDAMTAIAIVLLMVMVVANARIYSGHIRLVLSFVPYEWVSCLDSLDATVRTYSSKNPVCADGELAMYHSIVCTVYTI